MEDDPTLPDDSAADDTGAPVSQLPYERWMQDAMRQVTLRALDHVAREGLPDGHHFYITFRTTYPGVEIPKRLREQYPQEMTIVLQHQYWDLAVEETSQILSVGLSFGGVASMLVVPLAAVTAFTDPYVQFGLRLRPPPEPPPPPAIAAPEPVPAADAAAAETPQVVSLDAFRRRRD